MHENRDAENEIRKRTQEQNKKLKREVTKRNVVVKEYTYEIKCEMQFHQQINEPKKKENGIIENQLFQMIQ